MERGCLAKTKDYPGTVYWSVKAGAARGPVISLDRAALLGAASPKCALLSSFNLPQRLLSHQRAEQAGKI